MQKRGNYTTNLTSAVERSTVMVFGSFGRTNNSAVGLEHRADMPAPPQSWNSEHLNSRSWPWGHCHPSLLDYLPPRSRSGPSRHQWWSEVRCSLASWPGKWTPSQHSPRKCAGSPWRCWGQSHGHPEEGGSWHQGQGMPASCYSQGGKGNKIEQTHLLAMVQSTMCWSLPERPCF